MWGGTDGDTVTVSVKNGGEEVLGTFQVAKGTKLADAEDINALGNELCTSSMGLDWWYDENRRELDADFVITEDITIEPECMR